jgi:hypothetical protein
MAIRQQPGAAYRDTDPPYLSFACQIGTHRDCRESGPTGPAFEGLPLSYETCTCGCHQADDADNQTRTKAV